jgi:hypothetical protein
MKTLRVVAAVIHAEGKVFATQRGYGEYKDGWEFPGDTIMHFLIRSYEGEGKLDDYIANEPYVVEKVWEKIEIEPINVVIANGKE